MKQIESLIRGEMSAVQSINQILEKIEDGKEREELSSICQDHVMALDKLKRISQSEYQEDVQSSGVWGSFAKTFTGGATFFGNKAALTALKVGEEHGRNEYQEALASDGIDSNIREVIKSELLPNQEKHLKTIERYLQ